MHAERKYEILLEKLTAFLKSPEAGQSKIPIKEWEDRYTRLKAIRDWWGINWNEIERQVRSSEYPEPWIWESRADPAFKKYYELRMQLDKMEVLIR